MRRLRGSESGSVAVMMAICMTVFFGMAALGLDLASARYARLQLENATDAAAHAALVRLRATGSLAEASSMAISVAAANRVWGKNLTIRPSDITYGGWDFQHHNFTAGVSPPNAVQINGLRSALAGADGAINLTFARALGHAAINLTDQGTAAFRIRSVVVAQDITGSFAGDIDNARDADVTLLDQLRAYQIPSDRIGMQLFTGAGTEWTPLTNVWTGYAAVRTQWVGDGLPAGDPTKTSGLTVCNKLDLDPAYPAPFDHGWVPACSTGGDGTNQGAAIQAAINQLLAHTTPYETRVIVLITDGIPACCTTVGTWVSCTTTDACAAGLAQHGVDMADAAAAAGISIFTVSFGADPTQAAYNASLARGIGTAYNTPDSTQLATILSEIAGNVPIALVR
ncbi:MAG TPA: pilus assembly protein TadG-related protein [Polyangia bacterium]|nr:pilus assembly protein TadG-related protein [Polyangia bacterium]